MIPACYFGNSDHGIRCELCPRACVISEGNSGFCGAYAVHNGILYAVRFGKIVGMAVDPIEKKPLYHFYPGSTILSMGTYGCNLRCFFCQNCTISQTGPDPELPRTYLTTEQIVKSALSHPGNIGIAFTYNEPVVWFEYMYETAKLAKQAGLVTVMVTNGFINTEPLRVLLDVIDAFSVDLKSFNDDFYSKVTSSKLEPVKETLKQIKAAGKHVEIVNLVIPGLNDEEDLFTDMVKWISKEIGKDTVLHISRYFPNYKMVTEATPMAVIRRVKRIAENHLQYVYTGNMYADSNDTSCQFCNNILITRQLYSTKVVGLDLDGRCNSCGNFFLKKT